MGTVLKLMSIHHCLCLLPAALEYPEDEGDQGRRVQGGDVPVSNVDDTKPYEKLFPRLR